MTAQTATPAIPAHALGEAVGRIAGFAALSLHESFPDLDPEELVEVFTRPCAIAMISAQFLAGLGDGLPAGKAAAAGTALIRGWADSRNEARDQLDADKSAAAPTA
ncbi:hypothetical protein [Streptomyces niveus]|uniref:hypothetical protein n=1 Tax=Streptomyces niveus TaxID=193462 RepID=UPI0036D37F48